MDARVASLRVVVTPRAAADGVGPWTDGVLRVRVTRPPAGGEANRAVIRLVARALALPPSTVELVAGERARTKRLVVRGLSAEELATRLGRIGPGNG